MYHSGFVPIVWAVLSLGKGERNFVAVPAPDKAVAVPGNGYAPHKDAPLVAEREPLFQVVNAFRTERLNVHLLSRLQGRAHGPVWDSDDRERPLAVRNHEIPRRGRLFGAAFETRKHGVVGR